MKRSIFLKSIVSVFAVGLIGLHTPSALADDAKKLKVLIVDGQNNHNWKSTTPVMQKAFTDSGKFEVSVSTTPDKKKGTQEQWDAWRPVFADFDVVVSNYNGAMWPEEVRTAFEAYVGGGGGFVCIHAADNAFPDWAEYNLMIGLGGWGGRNEKSGPYLFVKDGKLMRDSSPGRGGSHGPQREFPVTTFPDSADHPIVKGLPMTWMHAKDELYDSMRGPAENVTVLATAVSEKSKKTEPMLMAIDYKEGRCFHSTLGHADYSMKCVGFITTLLRGAEWAATGAVTMEIPENFPTADASSSVE